MLLADKLQILSNSSNDKILSVQTATENKLQNLTPQYEVAVLRQSVDGDTVRLNDDPNSTRIRGIDTFETPHNEDWLQQPNNKRRMNEQRVLLGRQLGVPPSTVTNEQVFQAGLVDKQKMLDTVSPINTITDSHGKVLPSLVLAEQTMANEMTPQQQKNNYGRNLGTMQSLSGAYTATDGTEVIPTMSKVGVPSIGSQGHTTNSAMDIIRAQAGNIPTTSHSNAYDTDGYIAEGIDAAQSGIVKAAADAGNMVNKGVQALADKLGVKYTEEELKTMMNTVPGVTERLQELRTTEGADKYTGVNPKSREHQQELVKEASTAYDEAELALSKDDYKGYTIGKAKEIFANFKNTNMMLGDSMGEIAGMAINTIGVPLVVATRVSNNSEEYKKNNQNKAMDIDDILLATTLNSISLYGEKAIIKTGLGKALQGFMGKTTVGDKILGFLGSASGEYTQERFDQAIEGFIERDRSRDGTMSQLDLFKKYWNSKEAKMGGIAGLTMAGTLEGASATVGTAGTLIDKGITAASKNRSETTLDDIKVPEQEIKTSEVVKKQLMEVGNAIATGEYTKDLQGTYDKLYSLSKQTSDKELIATIETVRKDYFSELTSKELSTDSVILGSKEYAKDLIEDLVLFSEEPPKAGSILEKNIQKIAEANEVTAEDIASIVAKTMELVDKDAIYGPSGYRTYGKALRAAERAGDTIREELAIKKLESFKGTQEAKLNAIEKTIVDIKERLNSGVPLDAKVVKNAEGKDIRVVKVPNPKGGVYTEVRIDENNIIFGIDKVIAKTKENIAGINAELGTSRLNKEVKEEVVQPTKPTNPEVVRFESMVEKLDKDSIDNPANVEANKVKIEKLHNKIASLEGSVFQESSSEKKEEYSDVYEAEADVVTEYKPETGSVYKPKVDVVEDTQDNNLKNTIVSDKVETPIRTLGKLSDMVKQVTKKAVGTIKKTFVDKSKIEGVSKESPAMGLIYGKDGSVKSEVALALYTVGREYIAFNSNVLGKYKTKKDLASLLKKTEDFEIGSVEQAFYNENGMSTGVVADILGKNVLNVLGIKPNKEGDFREYARLVADLGNTVLHMMVSDGLIEYHEVGPTKYNETFGEGKANVALPFVRMSKEFNEGTSDFRKESVGKWSTEYKELAKELELDLGSRREPSTTKLPKKKAIVARNNKVAKVNQKVVDAINNAQGVKHVKVEESLAFIRDNKDLVMKLEGWVDIDTFEGSFDAKDSQIAKNRQVEKSIDELLTLDGDQFYFEWFYSKNGRYLMDSNTINPQSDTLHRFVVVPEEWTQTITAKEMKSFYYAVAQAIGVAVDKESTSTVQSKGEEFTKVPWKESLEAISKDDFKTDHVGHYLMAVYAVKAMQESKGGEFVATLSAEFDALTSGFGIKLMQYPILNDIQKWLQKVGVFIGKPIEGSMNDELASGRFFDSYQELASKVRVTLPKELEKNVLAQKLMEVLPKYVEGGKISKELRSLFKDPFMTFNYAAGFKSIKLSLSYNITGKIFDGIAKGDKQYDSIKSILEPMLKDGGNIVDVIKAQSVDMIKVKGKGTLGEALRNLVIDTYGAQVQSVLESQFGQFVKINELTNNAFKLMYTNFSTEYKKEISNLGEVITEADRLGIVHKLIDKFPIIAGPLSGMFEEGVAIFGKTKVTGDNSVAPVKTKLRGGNSTVSVIIKEIDAAMSAGAVIPIHFIDGAVMNYIMEKFKAQFIHDAIMPGIKDADNAVKAYNEEWYRVNTEYSVLEELIASMERNPKSTAELKGYKGESITYADTLAALKEINVEVRAQREWLKQQPVNVGHMVGMEGGIFKQGTFKAEEGYNTKQKEALLEEYKDVVLGSEEYTQIGDRGVGNDAAYGRMKQRTQDTYDYWKSQIGKEDYSNGQTVKNVKISNEVVIVSYNKGIDVRKQSISTLQNEDTTEIPTAKEEYLQSDILNTTEGIISLFTELADNSINVSKEYKELIISLLGKIDPQFLPNLKIYLNKEASKTGGVLDGKNIIVDVSVEELDANNAMTGAQVYAHEMVHAISKFAIETSRENTEAYNIIRQIMILRDKAQKAFTKNGELDYTVLLPKVSIDTAKEKTIAIKRINYIFNNANGIHEFIAHALTNPEFMTALDKLTIGNKSKDGKGVVRILKELWENLIDIVLGENTFKDIGTTYREAVLRLVFELTVYNNAAVVKVDRKRTLGETLIRTIDKIGNEPLAKLIDVIGDKLNQQDIKTPPKNATKMQYRLWAIKYLPQLLLRKDMEGIREQVLDVLGMSPDGAIMSIVRDLEDASGLERIVEQLGMDSDQIDRHRMMTVDSVHLMIQDKFKVPPTELEEEVMTSLIMDTDLSTIYKEYGVDIVENIIRDDKLLQKSIDKETKALEELKPEDMGWFTAQVQGLGVYLATGKSGIAQYLNVENIAKEVNVRDKEVIKLLDKLATLYAIKNTSKTAKEEFINIMSKEEAGVTYLVELQALTKMESDRVFDTGTNKIKGYSKELFDDSIDVKIGLVSDEKKMANEGFKLKEILVKDPNDSNPHPMALYVSNTYIVNSYNIHAVRITDTNRRGTSLTDIAFMTEGKDSKVVANADIKRLKQTRLKAIREMKEGVYVVNDEDKLSPIMDDAGNVVDFRYMMGKYSKKIYLKQETKITDVMGRTIASVQDKVDTDIQNKAVLEVIHADMEENYIPGFKNGKNGKRYIKIEKDSLNFKVAEIYKILPHSMLEAIKDSDEGYIAVRQDMLHNYFGFRDPSIMDHIWLTPLNRHYIGRIIRLAEKLWQEIVKISKIDIVIRTPAVFIGNVISNFMYSVINHMSIKEVFKLQVASFRNLNRYLEMEKKLEQLRIENKLGAKNDNIIRRLEKEQKLNPVYDLMEAGMYQAIVEDLGQREFKSSSKLARAIDTKTKNMPTWVKNGVNWLYITEKTGLFQTMTKATQMSDFVARATEYELLQRRGVSKEDAKLIVLDAFVNYSKPSSSREEYLNNMGLFMFTKYAKRIQRAIRHSGKKKPLNIILSAIGQEYFFDLDDIYDQSIFTRSYNNFDQDMFEHIKRVIFPTTLEIVF